MNADSAEASERDVQPSPLQSCRSIKSKGLSLTFKINGRTIPLKSEGGSTELRLSSSSGFTSIRIPDQTPVAPPSPAASSTPVISGGSTDLRLSSSSGFTSIRIPNVPPEAPPSPAHSSAPIISGSPSPREHEAGGVVSGEAAQKVLRDHLVNVEAPPPAGELRQVASALGLLHKGECSPAPPPACVTCSSQYRLITELRGFLCLCSPIITQSLIALKRKRKQRPLTRRRKDKNCISPSVNQSPDDVRPRPLPPDHSYTSIKPLKAEPAEGKLVILLEDFYYGSALGQKTVQSGRQRRTKIGPISCSVCNESLCNNIRLMQHMLTHVSSSDSVCPHCFRHFLSAAKLQTHVDEVHTSSDSTVTCRICELCFGSEPNLLSHMRTNHRPGEMPYTCQVCDFRSSSYCEVWTHFEQLHANTRNLLCHYCLRVLTSAACYQQHHALHQRSFNLTCHRCRLHFLFVRDRLKHEVIHHRTHIKPAQLSGLKPGTKVTVRTYSGTTDSTKDVDHPVRPSSRRPLQRKEVEPLKHLRHVSPAPQPGRCVECGQSVTDFSHHFLSVVHCWLCSYTTCCYTAYASHMISDHSHKQKRSSKYTTVFNPEPRLTHTLQCESCSLSTHRGDLMANHLSAWPEHTCTMLLPAGSSVCEDTAALEAANSVTSSGLGGAFVPVLLHSKPASSHLFIRSLSSAPPSLPAMTITFLMPPPQPAETLTQLTLVLQALCHGVDQAALRSHTPPRVIQSLLEQVGRDRLDGEWGWGAEPLAEWVLTRREQQLSVCEDVLLQTARTALGRVHDGVGQDHHGKWTQPELRACYSWTVDFLLRQEVGLHTITGTKLPRAVQDRSQCYAHSLQAQIRTFSVPRRRVCFLDEFPLFLDVGRFQRQDVLSLQFSSSEQQPPLVDVLLSALSDGTFLTPLVFFTGTAPSLPQGFPDNVMLNARPQGFTHNEKINCWIFKVWRPVLSSVAPGPSLLLMDSYRGHKDCSVRRSLTSMSTSVHYVPPSCSSLVQPLDVCLAPVLQDFLQSRWSQLVSEGGLDGLGLDQLVLTLCCWLSEVSSTLDAQPHFLSRSFEAVCDLQQLKERHKTHEMIHELGHALQSRTGSGTGPGPRPGPEPGTEPGTEPELKPGPEPGTELGPEPELKPRPEQELKSEPEPELKPRPVTEPELNLETGTEPELKLELKPEEKQSPVTEPKLEPELKPRAVTEPELKPEPEAKAEVEQMEEEQEEVQSVDRPQRQKEPESRLSRTSNVTKNQTETMSGTRTRSGTRWWSGIKTRSGTRSRTGQGSV